MKAAAIVVTAAIIATLAVSVGCGGDDAWVTLIEEGQTVGSADRHAMKSEPFELTGAEWRLRYDLAVTDLLDAYIVPMDDATDRSVLLEGHYGQRGETTAPVGPGYYYLDIEGIDTGARWSLWVEEKR
jgi:hypothetical protein